MLKGEGEGAHPINFGRRNTNDCMTKRTTVHEMLHRLGFAHEHTNPNRDKVMKINWLNIKVAVLL